MSNTQEQHIKPEMKSGRKSTAIKNIFDGSVLTNKSVVNQLPFIMFLVVLSFVYIGNRYNSEKIILKILDLQKEVQDLKTEQMTISFELMDLSRQSKVLKQVTENNIGLEEAVVPPKIIVVE